MQMIQDIVKNHLQNKTSCIFTNDHVQREQKLIICICIVNS